MTRYVLTPGVDRPDMVHKEPWDDERCPIEEVWHTEINAEQASYLLGVGKAIACRRCGLSAISKPGDIPILYQVRPD
jgi:hypothetical protein